MDAPATGHSATPVVLELSSLPTRHAYGYGLLDRFGMPTVCRLSIDPTSLSPSNKERELAIEWIAPPGNSSPAQVRRAVGWRDLPNAEMIAPQVRWSVNATHLTEYAACGIMALLIHDLGQEIILNVLQIGEGPDYLILRARCATVAAVETSGLRQVDYPSQSEHRVQLKRTSLLAQFESGYVSVTTFSHPPGAIAHSYLHFVTRPTAKATRSRAGRRNTATKKGATLTTLDPNSKAGQVAAKAQAALMSGDTTMARQLYSEAGAILANQIEGAREQSEKHLIRFLAATQYHQGGEYRDALKLVERVEEKKLSAEVRGLFPAFFRAVKERADPGYAQGIRNRLKSHWDQREYREIVAMLQHHPYVLERSGLAFLRSHLCQQLGDYKAGAIFFASSYRFGLTALDLVIGGAVMPLQLLQAKGEESAWDAARLAVEFLPHTATAVVASMVAHRLARAKRGDERLLWSQRQLSLFRDAWERFQPHATEYSEDWEFVVLMASCAGAAAYAALRLDDRSAALEMVEAGESLAPRSPEIIDLLNQIRRQLAGSPEVLADTQDADSLLGDAIIRRLTNRAALFDAAFTLKV